LSRGKNRKYFDPIYAKPVGKVPELNRLLMTYLTKQDIVQEPSDGSVDSPSFRQPFGVLDDDLLLGSTLPPIQDMRQPQAQDLQQVQQVQQLSEQQLSEQQDEDEQQSFIDSDDNNGGG
jgi:hypothetical protein